MALVTQTVAGAAPHSGPDAEPTDIGSGQLDYSLTTVPDPLKVSPAGTVETPDVIIVGSRLRHGDIETNEIAVYVPIGSDARTLVLDYTGMQPETNLNDWTPTPDPANQRILFKPKSGVATLTPEQGLTIQLNKLRINRQVGTAPIIMALKWRDAGTSGSFRTEEQALGIGKFPATFFLRDFKARDAYIDNDDSVVLGWECSAGEHFTYKLLYEDKEIDVTDYSSYTVRNVRRNTMFYLEGIAQQGTGSATLRLSTYVAVRQPDLDANDLSVAGTFQALSAPQRLPSFSDGPGASTRYFTPPTDGLLLVEASRTWLRVDTNGLGDMAYSATIGVGPNAMEGNVAVTGTVPLRKGQRVQLTRTGDSGNVKLLWFSFGGVPLEVDW